MSLPKSVVHVALTGLNEKAGEEVSDAQAVLTVCENLEFREDGIPRTRKGYGEISSYPSNTFVNTCSPAGGRYVLTNHECRRLVFNSGVPQLVSNNHFSERMGCVTRCSPERIATLGARFPTARATGGVNDRNTTVYSRIAYDCYVANSGDSQMAVVVSAPVYSVGKTSNDKVSVMTLSLVDVASGTVVDTTDIGLYIDGATYRNAEVFKIIGNSTSFYIMVAGHVVASPGNAVIYTGTFTSTAFGTVSATATVTDYLTAAGATGLTGLIAGTYNNTSSSTGDHRAYFAYHISGFDGFANPLDGGSFKIIRLASGGTISHTVQIDQSDTTIAATQNCAFGVFWHKQSDHVMYTYADTTASAGMRIGFKSATLASDITARTGGTATTEWTGFTARYDAIVHLSRVSVFPSDDDATGTSHKCFGIAAFVTYLSSSKHFTQIAWAQFGTAGASDSIALTYAPATRIIAGVVLISTPYTPCVEAPYHTLMPVASFTDYDQDALRSQGLIYRVDGRSNVSDPASNPAAVGPQESPFFQCVGAVASGTLFYPSDTDIFFWRSQRTPTSGVYITSSDTENSVLAAGVTDGVNYINPSSSSIPGAPQGVGLYRVSHHVKHTSRVTGDFGTIFSSGYPMNDDGGAFVEACQPLGPVLRTTTTAGSSAVITSSSVIYRGMLEYETATGHVIWSELSLPLTLALGGNVTSITVTAMAPVLRQLKPNRQVRIHIFRRESDADRYVGSMDLNDTQYLTTAAYPSLFDSTATASLGALQTPYYDAAKVGLGGPLPRTPAPSMRSVCIHKDRIFGIDEDGAIRFTGPYVTGEHPWWSEVFTISAVGGGRATALASSGGRLFIMKRDETYVVDGDGPPQNGGNGTEFSLPQKLSGSLGCIESRSVVETPYGVFMRSQRGFELISPGGSIEFVGERIQRTARTYPTTVAAVYDADRDCVKFLVASATEPANGYVAGTAGGAILCFYAKSNAWSVHKVPVGAVADSVFSDMTIVDTGTERITVLFSADGRVFPEKTTAAYSSTLYQDPTSKPVVCKLATSWIKQNGAVNTRFRLYGAEMFALKQTLHTVIMKLYTNYSSSAQDNKTFNPPATSATPEILVIEPSIQQVYSAKLEVTYQEPDTGSVGTGEGTRVLQLAMSIGAQDGLPRVPAVQRK